jgi:flagellar hook assembly protein FlgD
VTLTFDNVRDMKLEPNSPNPFVNNTVISFYLPSSQNVKLEVVDMFGKVVNFIENGFLNAFDHSYDYDGKDMQGKPLPTGSYILRLTSENQVQTGKMTIIR